MKQIQLDMNMNLFKNLEEGYSIDFVESISAISVVESLQKAHMEVEHNLNVCTK
jgi:hypothetical protein